MAHPGNKNTTMDIESPTSKEDRGLLLAPWANNHISFNNEPPSPIIHKSASSIFSYNQNQKSPGSGSLGRR